jgi:pimeloyl-ACP methyl ester carboxylesterase
MPSGRRDFASTDVSSNAKDLVHAAGSLRAHHAVPSILIGHSLGGAAVLAATENVPETRALVTLAHPSRRSSSGGCTPPTTRRWRSTTLARYSTPPTTPRRSSASTRHRSVRAGLLEAADRCPAHKTLGEVLVDTTLVAGDSAGPDLESPEPNLSGPAAA